MRVGKPPPLSPPFPVTLNPPPSSLTVGLRDSAGRLSTHSGVGIRSLTAATSYVAAAEQIFGPKQGTHVGNKAMERNGTLSVAAVRPKRQLEKLGL